MLLHICSVGSIDEYRGERGKAKERAGAHGFLGKTRRVLQNGAKAIDTDASFCQDRGILD